MSWIFVLISLLLPHSLFSLSIWSMILLYLSVLTFFGQVLLDKNFIAISSASKKAGAAKCSCFPSFIFCFYDWFPWYWSLPNPRIIEKIGWRKKSPTPKPKPCPNALQLILRINIVERDQGFPARFSGLWKNLPVRDHVEDIIDQPQSWIDSPDSSDHGCTC